MGIELGGFFTDKENHPNPFTEYIPIASGPLEVMKKLMLNFTGYLFFVALIISTGQAISPEQTPDTTRGRTHFTKQLEGKTFGLYFDRNDYPDLDNTSQWYITEFLHETYIALNKNKYHISFENLNAPFNSTIITSKRMGIYNPHAKDSIYINFPFYSDTTRLKNLGYLILIQNIRFGDIKVPNRQKEFVLSAAFGLVGAAIAVSTDEKTSSSISYLLYDIKLRKFQYYDIAHFEVSPGMKKTPKMIKKEASMFKSKVLNTLKSSFRRDRGSL